MTTALNYHLDLGRDSLAELLHKLYLHRVPGVVEARRGDIVKRVFVKDGNVIYATSSDRSDGLAAFLLRNGLVSEEALAEVNRERANGRKRLGVLLIERSLLSPAMLHTAIRQQVEEVAWSLFTWDDGEIDIGLQEMPNRNVIQIHVPMRSMILRGLRRSSETRSMIGRIGDRNTVLETSAHPEDLIDIGIDEKEYQLLQLVDGHRSLYELCQQGPFPAAENARVIYAFHVLQLVRKRSSQHAVKIRLRPDGRV